MQTFKKIFLFTALALTVLVIVGYGWLRTSLPQMEGTLTLNGIQNTVTIARDENAVPHITAKNMDDLMFGLGFAHAQDRLWQMEMNRRIGMGRLSEVVGESGLPADKLFRTLNFAGKAQKAYQNLPQDGKDALLSYASGVNAYLATRKGALPSEYILTGLTPEPWQPLHSMVWLKMMSYDLGGNMRTELARAELMAQLSPAQVQELYPTYPGDPAEVPLPDIKDILKGLPLKELASLMPEPSASLGSNNWVISGEHTKSGKPMLANDPHLTLRAPSVWYLAHLRLEDSDGTAYNQIGVSFPGVPMIVLGRTNSIAIGFTNTAPDVQDLFIEKITNAEGTEYKTPTGVAAFTLRNETIKVKDAEDIKITVRESRHGPVVSDIFRGLNTTMGDDHVLALQWTTLEDIDNNIMMGLSMLRVRNFEDFVAAASTFSSPQQNMIYADMEGNIGYFAPAKVPLRHPDNPIKGRLPSPGWDSRFDWQGYIPYEALPKKYNPDNGMIATANEKIVDANYPYFITRDWSLPYRGNRIRNLLTAHGDHDFKTFSAIQNDTVSDMAKEMLPLMLDLAKAMPEDINRTLRAWTYDMDKTSAEAVIFAHWWRTLSENITKDELGPLFARHNRQRPIFMKNVLKNVNGQARWCDDITTSDIETCDFMVDKSFTTMIEDLSELYGNTWQDWQWGKAHTLKQIHTPFSNVPSLSEYYSLSEPHGGSTYTVNVAGVSWGGGTKQTFSHGPSYRGIFDLSDLEKSLYTFSSGQSGNVFSSHYDDLFPQWSAGKYFTIEGKAAIPSNVKYILNLKPVEK